MKTWGCSDMLRLGTFETRQKQRRTEHTEERTENRMESNNMLTCGDGKRGYNRKTGKACHQNSVHKGQKKHLKKLLHDFSYEVKGLG
jgi:hypothetical protein